MGGWGVCRENILWLSGGTGTQNLWRLCFCVLNAFHMGWYVIYPEDVNFRPVSIAYWQLV